MSPRHSLALLTLVVGLPACAPAHPRVAPSAAQAEISFDLSITPARARDQLVAAFEQQGLSVASSQPGSVEYHAPRERGILGQYEVFARAVISPVDCGTHVTLFGEETRYESATSTEGTAVRIGPSSTGRAHDVWKKLEAVANAVRNGAVTHATSD